MAKKSTERKIGKTQISEKKPLIDPRYKSPIYTAIFLFVCLVFFVYNNFLTTEQEHGPLPPYYKAAAADSAAHDSTAVKPN